MNYLLEHQNIIFSDCQKLQYLKSACKDNALKIIQIIHISDGNYKITLNLLKKRYRNKRKLINALVKLVCCGHHKTFFYINVVH